MRDAIDIIARETERDSGAVISEAIDAYLDVRRWQMLDVAEGLRQANAGEFADDECCRRFRALSFDLRYTALALADIKTVRAKPRFKA